MPRKRSSGKHYAWSELRNGGEVDEIRSVGNVVRTVVTKRNIVAHGAEVSQSDLGVSDEEWDHLIESGSVRSYPVPEEANDSISPARAIIAKMTDPDGNIKTDMLMELAMKHPEGFTVSEGEEATEIPAGA